MSENRSRGRPARISRDQIVDTALAIGLDQFTMHNVAARLKVTTPALYSHVESRAELVELVAERIVGQIEDDLPSEDDWRAWLRGFADSCRSTLDGSQLTIITRLDDPTASAKVRVAERGLGLLIRAGFEPADAGRAIWLVFRTAITAGSDTEPSIEAQRHMDRDLIDPPDELPNLDAVATAMNHEGVVDTLDDDLRIVLDGLSALLDRTRAGNRTNGRDAP